MKIRSASIRAAKRYSDLEEGASWKFKIFIVLVFATIFAFPVLFIWATLSSRPKPLPKPPPKNCESELPDAAKVFNPLTRQLMQLTQAHNATYAPVFSNNSCQMNQTSVFFLNKTTPTNYEEILLQRGDVQPGGAWQPEFNCTARSRIAIIVPYRDRDSHLRVFLNVMHEFLQRQQLEYRIFVVEQSGQAPFNRAALLNIGFYEALRVADESLSLADLADLVNVFVKNVIPPDDHMNMTRLTELFTRLRSSYQCFAFHDVDLLPENGRMPYWCPRGGPRHLVTASEKFSYKTIYGEYFGGAAILTLEQYLRINGMSNLYFGWGGEDDDLADRVQQFWKIAHCPAEIGRYSALHHANLKESEKNSLRFELWHNWARRWTVDGLNSLTNCSVRVLSHIKPLFTHVVAHIDHWAVPSPRSF